MRVSDLRLLGVVGAFGLIVGGCDNGGSAVETRDRSTQTAEVGTTGSTDVDADAGASPSAEPRPVMTASRRETTDAKVVRLFERNGSDFGARSASDYLAKVTAFIEQPPRGTERVERPNGDVLLYQASTNTFAVVSRDGVPKTMFKPDDGPTYWAQQKERAPTFGQRRAASSE